MISAADQCVGPSTGSMRIKQRHLATQAIEFGEVYRAIFEDPIVNQRASSCNSGNDHEGRIPAIVATQAILIVRDHSRNQRTMARIRSAAGVPVCCDQASTVAARASAEPARTCGPP
jgi:hypothetical protein